MACMLDDSILISADEFMEIQTPETVRLELDRGKLIVSPHNSFEHQYAARELLLLISVWAARTKAGVVVHEMDIRLDRSTVRDPDIAFIAVEQKQIIRRNQIVGGPKLVIEVLSRSTETVDRGPKMRQYAEAGVAHYWLVDPLARTIECYANHAGKFALLRTVAEDAELAPPEFPGLGIPLRQLWLDQLPPED